ncbi:hypothetical protein [Streptomyces sp. AC550_RSS872]|uniref:hypothetical protein n=1 Tax=Streptomyces sp. AC550_RSS872 TaxID=2823689 RepID=UPI001C2552B7|nr:hypothetical protein [Streptomyces sp. AC550_RSS872]
MSVAPASAGVEQIVRRPFATATSLAVLADGTTAGDGALLGRGTCGTATGFQRSRVRHPASTPSRHP